MQSLNKYNYNNEVDKQKSIDTEAANAKILQIAINLIKENKCDKFINQVTSFSTDQILKLKNNL